MSTLPQSVRIVEVGPRDGLQNEGQIIDAQTKIALINRLLKAGIKHIEVGAFVSPKWVPQMATSTEVLQGIERLNDVTYSVLVPNMKGLEAALSARVDEVVIFTAASEAFAQKNINCSISESITRFAEVAKVSKQNKLRLRGSISCSLGCPYQGEVAVDAVLDVVKQLRDLGCDEIDIADTIGVGTAKQVQELFVRGLPNWS